MPNRILKESICTSESLNQLSWFDQVFFDHLIVNCDDYGRMDARPAILKAKLFPLNGAITSQDIEKALGNLVRVECVRLYESDGKPYLYLPSWEKHQTRRAKSSKYPAPESRLPADENSSNHMNADASSGTHMSPYSYSNSGTYSGYENGNGNEIENEKRPVTPQGAEAGTEKSTNEAEQSESLTVETARGTGDKEPVDHSTTSVQQERFSEFWRHYPRKVGKGAAEKALEKIHPDEALFARILSAIELQKQCDQWRREEGRYIPYPATWLNQTRWEDEPDLVPPSDPPPSDQGTPPGESTELPADLVRAKQQHEEAMRRFSAGEGSWEDLVPE